MNYSDLIQAVQASLHTCPSKSLWDPSVHLRDQRHQCCGTAGHDSIPLQTPPKIHDAELTAADVTGVCLNNFCNPAQCKHWQKLGELHVYLWQNLLKLFPVAPESSRWNSQCELGGLMVLHLCVQPSISSVWHLLAETLFKECWMSTYQVLLRSHQTLLWTAVVSLVSTMPGCALGVPSMSAQVFSPGPLF